ncbi:FAD-dependent oxidoreductase [Desulfococcaceae bacterium HSG7]|nr:FAD-dependent oxidoreductase [Desulfococcaceae bacterium HSG7]
MIPKAEADVIVIGAGLQGCSTALYLARAGQRVIVFDKDTAGRHASGVNAGGVRRLFRAVEEIPLSLAASEIWPDMRTLVGSDCGFKPSGQVKIAENDADMQKLAVREAKVRSLGYTHEVLIDRQALRLMVPAVSDHCAGALICRGDGFAEPFATVRAFRNKAIELGVAIHEKHPVTALAHTGNSWHVQAGGRTYAAQVIVNCAGAWGGRIAAMIGDSAPLTPVALTMMVTARSAHFLDPVVGLTSRQLSFKQMNNGTVVIGGGHLSKLDMAAGRTEIDFSAMAVSAQTAIDIFPLMQNVPAVRCWAGIEGIMPDNLPVIGPGRASSGAYHAFGFSAHGFQLSPIIGKIMTELIIEGKSRLPIHAFRIDRFDPSDGLPLDSDIVIST